MDRAYVFLDRDGTLIEDVHQGHRLEEYLLLPGKLDALGRLRQAGFRLAIVTNQIGISRGLFGMDDYARYHGRLLDDLSSAGLEIDATYMCPHVPDAGCECRKPGPASLHRARAELGADLGASWVVGDHLSDVQLAVNAGSRGILVLTGHGEVERPKLGTTPATVVADIAGAARHILEAPHRGGRSA
ncbi:MAG: D-glycero-alpha-D-manno-heptose-1,7-bisphosphate 7-phosphatase [Alphaproteobacteria bacterium]